MPSPSPLRRILLVLVLVGSACSRGGGAVPGPAELPEVFAEAAGRKSVRPWKDSPARQAIRNAVKRVIDGDKRRMEEINRLFRRPELDSYFLLEESYIGGKFPAGTAKYLREVQSLEEEYLGEMEAFPDILDGALKRAGVPDDRRGPAVAEVTKAVSAQRAANEAAVAAHLRFVKEAAVLYELVAGRPESLKAMRTGLEITDSALLERFNEQVDRVNAASAAAEAAVATLNASGEARLTIPKR